MSTPAPIHWLDDYNDKELSLGTMKNLTRVVAC
jgi:hypothetical protein